MYLVGKILSVTHRGVFLTSSNNTIRATQTILQALRNVFI